MTSGLMLVTSSTIIIKHENGDLKTIFFSTDDNKLCCISPFLLVGCFFVNIYLLDGIHICIYMLYIYILYIHIHTHKFTIECYSQATSSSERR